ncbi:MAG: carboxypeptidase-like regulatory domain-containing protein [Bacteroidia bacterium]|nr:carboxypeptidase-like regulatory domain-containing protein [Bacteroidia bacterium]
MRRYFIILFVIYISKICIAQNAVITGVVRLKSNNELLEFAKISLDNKFITFSDIKGNFIFKNVDTGYHNLKIYYIGFDDYEKKFHLNINQTLLTFNDIFLEEKSIRIKEITIYGNPELYNRNYEGSNVSLSPKLVKNIRAIGTEEILKYAPGINISGDMGISNRLNAGIRGSYPRRSVNILLMEDGTPIAPAPYLAPEAYYNPPSDRIDAVEIIKGSDIIAFGTNTMYGAINYITKKPPITPTLSLNLSSGTYNYLSNFITYGGTWNNIGAEIQILNKSFDGYIQNTSTNIFNFTAKLYSEVSKKSSFYLKLNFNNEKSKASYSALTPFTFRNDATQNPFDADDLMSKRYAVDLIYNYRNNCGYIFSTKVYASQFQRDWWRQENTLIKASSLKSYVGENIYQQKYSYLNNLLFGDDDYIRVGKLVSGKEQTRARNRVFKVLGLQESIKKDFKIKKIKSETEIILRNHFEFFDNIEIKNDSSRFSRSGILDKDNYYELSANSIYLRNKFEYLLFSITPHVRFESVTMFSFDRLAISKNTKNDGSKYFGSLKNTYNSFTPGISINYSLIKNQLQTINFIGGIYSGYNAPTSDVGFMKVENDVVKKANSSDEINRNPEKSINYEIGTRGCLQNNKLSFQIVFFNNTISNYYSAGRNEAFQTLGKVNINGFENSVSFNLGKFLSLKKHDLSVNFAGTFMNSRIIDGILTDSDILKAKHNQNTKNEIIEKINQERNGYNVYINSSKNTDSIIFRNINTSEFNNIKKIDYVFENDKLKSKTLPYVPKAIINFSVNYKYAGLSILLSYNYVSSQYTDYFNLKNETSEGAIGMLENYSTIDLNANYIFINSKNKTLRNSSIFIDCKNLTNEIYEASRLHRVSSGIIPSGFRQINTGIKININ